MKKIISLSLVFVSLMGFSQDDFYTEFYVTDFNDNPLSESQIQIFDMTGKFLQSKITDDVGKFDTRLVVGKYHIKLSQDGVLKKEADVSISPLEGREVYNRVRVFVLYEEEETFTIEDLNFETSSAVIKEESFPILNKLANYLKSKGDERFEISGHTDSDGAEASNLILSSNRADAVLLYLIGKGVNSDQLSAKGYGELKPIADNASDEGKALNRRTELRRLGE